MSETKPIEYRVSTAEIGACVIGAASPARARILESVSGKRLEAYLQESLFAPLA